MLINKTYSLVQNILFSALRITRMPSTTWEKKELNWIHIFWEDDVHNLNHLFLYIISSPSFIFLSCISFLKQNFRISKTNVNELISFQYLYLHIVEFISMSEGSDERAASLVAKLHGSAFWRKPVAKTLASQSAVMQLLVASQILMDIRLSSSTSTQLNV